MTNTHHIKTLTALLGLTCVGSLSAATTAFYRLEGAANAAITEATDSSGNGLNGTNISGAPVYSSDTAAPFIFDPTSGQSFSNTTSLDGTVRNSHINVTSSPLMNSTSFTVEAFVKIVGQPGSFDSFIRRSQSSGNRWQLDFDHSGTGTAFGRGRSRFDSTDNPGGVNLTVRLDSPMDENRLFIDTQLNDGNSASYGAPDVASEGDGINDLPIWHHIAVTFDGTTNTATYFVDYIQGSSAEITGFMHPDAVFEFGKLSNNVDLGGYEFFIDEVKLSDTVLPADQFLVASNTNIPEPSSALLALLGVVGALGRRRR